MNEWAFVAMYPFAVVGMYAVAKWCLGGPDAPRHGIGTCCRVAELDLDKISAPFFPLLRPGTTEEYAKFLGQLDDWFSKHYPGQEGIYEGCDTIASFLRGEEETKQAVRAWMHREVDRLTAERDMHKHQSGCMEFGTGDGCCPECNELQDAVRASTEKLPAQVVETETGEER